MPSSSPDYAITKPGMAHYPLRKRDKPLRTYGKRSISTPEPRGEPPSKRARHETDEPTRKRNNTLAPTQSDARPNGQPSEQAPKDQGTVQSVEGETPKAQSILSYFKPVAPLEKPVSSDDTIEEPEAPSSPPVSSGATRQKRRPRLLRLRATSSPLSDAPDDGADGREDTNKRKRHSSDADDGGAYGRKVGGSPLRDGDDNRLNQSKAGRPSDESKPGGAAKAKKAPTVQTTLNISAQAAFAECKVCGMVWNPLYPDDVKYHSKRHATVVRARRKQEEEEL